MLPRPAPAVGCGFVRGSGPPPPPPRPPTAPPPPPSPPPPPANTNPTSLLSNITLTSSSHPHTLPPLQLRIILVDGRSDANVRALAALAQLLPQSNSAPQPDIVHVPATDFCALFSALPASATPQNIDALCALPLAAAQLHFVTAALSSSTACATPATRLWCCAGACSCTLSFRVIHPILFLNTPQRRRFFSAGSNRARRFGTRAPSLAPTATHTAASSPLSTAGSCDVWSAKAPRAGMGAHVTQRDAGLITPLSPLACSFDSASRVASRLGTLTTVAATLLRCRRRPR
jgi:hypothetical protein